MKLIAVALLGAYCGYVSFDRTIGDARREAERKFTSAILREAENCDDKRIAIKMLEELKKHNEQSKD